MNDFAFRGLRDELWDLKSRLVKVRGEISSAEAEVRMCRSTEARIAEAITMTERALARLENDDDLARLGKGIAAAVRKGLAEPDRGPSASE